MISERRAAQMGLLAAAAVFVLSIGVIISQSGDKSSNDGASQLPAHTVAVESHPSQNLPMPLSAPADPRALASR